MKFFSLFLLLVLGGSVLAQYGKIVDYPDKEAQFKGGP